MNRFQLNITLLCNFFNHLSSRQRRHLLKGLSWPMWSVWIRSHLWKQLTQQSGTQKEFIDEKFLKAKKYNGLFLDKRLKVSVSRDFLPVLFSWLELIWVPEKHTKIFQLRFRFHRDIQKVWLRDVHVHRGVEILGLVNPFIQ